MLYDFHFDQHPLMLVIIAGILTFSLLTIVIYHVFFFRRLAAFRQPKADHASTKKLPSVSVVIAARNEYLNLKENLPFLLNQDYPEFEILVVDDHSQDDSWDLLCAFRIHNPHLRIIRLTDSVVVCEGKKFPLSVGIKEAAFSRLLLTDADCRPVGPFWIRQMIEAAGGQGQFVLGYGKFYRRRGLLNKLIRFDALHVATMYFSAALSGFPYMGVGRNLSYRKETFIESGGFVQHYDLSSGDDDLFVSENAKKNEMSISLHPNSFMFSEPKKRWSAWWHQKRRHMTTGNRYRFNTKLYLSLYFLVIVLFPASAAVLLLSNYQLAAVAGMILIKWIIQWISFRRITKKLKEKNLLLISPVFETILALLYALIHISNILKKPGRWK